MRHSRALPILALIVVLGCTQSTTTAPADMRHAPTGGSVSAGASGGLVLSPAGTYTLSIDPDGLVADLAPKAVREGAANDDLYLLPITNFLRRDSVRVLSLSESDATLELRYQITHPIPGPVDPTAPASGQNRADLGISGMALFLLDVPAKAGHLYFAQSPDDEVVVNTRLIRNADAYYRPRALVQTALRTNTFPYQLLVDESHGSTGSRVGVSNGGAVTGNYGADGWTRAELGPGAPFNGWTGFGVLHQGQASVNTLSLDLEWLRSAGPMAFDVAILAKYTDPRGGLTIDERRANRLPPATPDASLFAYRMPHGAMDIQRIEYKGERGSGFRINEASSATLSFHVEDWDARATETIQTDLALESDVTLVAQGSAGVPAFAICLPGILGDPSVVDLWDPAVHLLDDDSIVAGDPEVDSGHPGDALYYSKQVDKPAGTGELEGTYTGLARAIDPEPASLTVMLDAALQPVTVDVPAAEVYQAFAVQMSGPPAPQTGWAKLLDPGADQWAEATGVAIDGDSNVIVCGFFHHTIDFGGGLRSSLGGMDNFVVKFSRQGEYRWDYTWGSTSDENYRHVRADSQGNVYVGGSFDGVTDFDRTGPLAPVTNNRREDAFLMRLSPSGLFQWVRIFGDLAAAPEAEVAKSMSVDDTGVYLGGFFRSSGLPFAPSDPNDWDSVTAGAFIVKLLPNGDFVWSRAFDGGLHDEMRGLASDGAGGLLGVCDFYSDVIDFGGGPRTNTDGSGKTDDMALIRLDATTGAYVVDNKFTGSSIEQPQALAANNGYVALTGHTWSTDLDLGGGVLPHVASSDFYWGRFDAVSLTHQFSGMLGSEAYDPGFGVAVDSTGAVYVAGLYQGTIDFGFGPQTPVMQDGFIYKLAPDGEPAWVHTWGGAVDFVRAQGLACDDISVVAVGTSGVGGPIDYEPGSDVTELTGFGICGSVIRDLSDGTW